MLNRILTVCSLTCVALLPLHAAVQVEVDTYASLVKRVIDREIGVVADRAIEDFAAFAGPQSTTARILRLHYARTFALVKTGAEGQRLAEEADRLETELTSLANNPDVDPDLRGLIKQGPFKKVIGLVNPLLRDLNPQMPVPAKALLPTGFVERIQRRVQLLQQTVDQSLPPLMAEVEAWEPKVAQVYEKVDWSDADWQVLFEATRRRMDVINIFYFAQKAFAEILARGDEFGVPPETIASIDAWLEAKMKEWSETFDEWDYNYGDYNLDFKHRMLVMRMEAARKHGIQFYTPEEVLPYIEELIQLDESQFNRVDQRRYARDLKLTLLDEVILWSIALAKSAESDEEWRDVLNISARFWKDFYRDLRDDIRSRNDDIANAAAKHYIYAARLFMELGQQSDALGLMSEILAVDNPPHEYAFNAKAWQEKVLTEGSGGPTNWGAPPEAQDPETAISLAFSFRRAADKKADPEESQALRLKAAIALRNGIAGLNQPEYADKFVEHAPRLYQLYAYVLNELGWTEHASVVAEAGVQAMRPRWGEPPRFEGNAWGDPRSRGQLTDAGELVTRLMDDFVSYSSRVARSLDNDANSDRSTRALRLQKELNPDAEGGEKRLVAAAIQDERYEEALRLVDENLPKVDNLADRIWYARAAVNVLYLWVNQEDDADFSDETLLDRLSERLEKRVATLEEMIAPELAKGDDGLEVARVAQSTITAVAIAELARQERWEEIMERLDADFWAGVSDAKTQVRMMNQLSNAAYRHRLTISKQVAAQPSNDPALLTGPWPLYRNAVASLELVQERLGQTLTGSSKRLTGVMQQVSKHAKWFVENVEAGADGFTEIDPEVYADLTRIAKQSTIAYVDLYVPTLSPGQADELTWVALGNDLWAIGAKDRSLEFYERYISAVSERADLQAYRDDPRSVVDPVRDAVVAARSSYREDFAPIRDFLVDAPGLIDHYQKVSGDPEKMNEKKVDYPRALNLLREFREKVQRERALLSNADKVLQQIDDLLETVKELARTLQIKSRLAQAYMEMGETPRAVELSGELIAYDPLYPPYMTVFVEGVLMKGPEASQKELKEAQILAAKVRNFSRNDRDEVMQYWTSAIQVLEISLLLGEVDLVNRTLQRYGIDHEFPPMDLRVRGTQPPQARDAGDAAIWKRFLELYEAEGIKDRREKPYRIVEDDEGNPTAIMDQSE